MRLTIYAISILLFIPLNGDADIWILLYKMQSVFQVQVGGRYRLLALYHSTYNHQPRSQADLDKI
jgi:hypothetical protein